MTSTAIITISIILVILAAIAAMYIGQLRERARIERSRKINALNDKQRRMNQLFQDIPSQYLNKELRQLILEQRLESLQKLLPLKNDKQVADSLNECEELLDKLKQDKLQFQKMEITTNEHAKEIAKQLEILFKFLETQRKKKRLDPQSAKKYMGHILYLSRKCRADYFVHKASQAIKDGKLRVAIHNYHNAVQEFATIKDNPVAAKAINTYKVKIKELDALASQQGKPETNTTEEDKQAQASKEWDSFMDNDDAWKKKNAYDD